MISRALVIGALTLVASAAWAESLWTPQSQSLYADRRAHAVGDVLTVAIVESVSATHAASHQTEKQMEAEGMAGSGLLSFLPDLTTAASRQSHGSGNTTTATRITDQLSVTISAIDPQGNLCLSGGRTLELGADKLELQFRGKVRPEDVGLNNVVYSTQVAELSVTWKGAGPIAEKQQPGVLYRLLRWLW